MPVLILGAPSELDIVRPLAIRLLEDGGEVRCFLDEDDYELRSAGCKIAVGDTTDADGIEGALTNAHTFIPLLPDPLGLGGDEDLDTLRSMGIAAAAAAAGSEIEQTILAIPALSTDPVAGAFRSVKEALEGACRRLCVFETGFLWGPSRPLAGAARGWSGQMPSHAINVVPIEDLVEALVRCDDREEMHGNWQLGGTPTSPADLAGAAGPGEERALRGLAILALTGGVRADDSAYLELGLQPAGITRLESVER